MGAADFIPKPYNIPEVIMARISRTIQLYENTSIITATQTDELTGLYNKEYFMEYAVVYDHYYPDAQMDAVAFDINRFHIINEMHGRSFGNEVLLRIGEKIREYVRNNKGIACRFNADSFYMYLPHVDDVGTLYDCIREGIEDVLEDAGARLRMGVYADVDRSLEINRRFDCALLACNSVRGSLSSTIAFYDEKMHEREAYEEKLISDMEKGLSQKQFKVYYQPKFNVTGEEPFLTSAEALVRWEHPQFGLIRPDHFIPLFEENGLIHKLDRYVWSEVASRILDWKKRFGVSVPVSVNVSRIDILEPDFIRYISKLVRDNGLRPEEFLLEITESAYTEDSEEIIETVNRLRAMGYKVEMDDFGTGYSSLNMLSCLPVDALKLDKKFIDNIQENSREMRMVTLVMDIAEYLGVTVVAEGVETAEQLELLKNTGCHVIQGYYFSMPVPADEFEGFIGTETDIEVNDIGCE
jgi:diguanylate cyclase (GGDEF)-like protein